MDNKKDKLISFIIPVFNEAASLKEFFSILSSAIIKYNIINYEVLFIDDGSVDSSWQEISLIKRSNKNVFSYKLRKNFGKSFALNIGFKKASGDYVFTMDSDLQDDPNEINKFLDKIQEGYDLVSGWKKERNDPITKTLPSIIFNFITRKITKIELHDFNCGFKLYKKNVVKNIEIYGELHRYIPVLAASKGYKVSEVEVKHIARKFGKSKFGSERFLRGFFDLITVISTTKYLLKPGHLFGRVGIFFGFIGSLILFYLLLIKISGALIGQRPLLFLGFLLITLSIQFLSLGIIAELVIKNSKSSEYDEDCIEEYL